MNTFLERQTYIVVADENLMLLPSPDLYPSSDLFPGELEMIDNIVENSMRISDILIDGDLQFGQLYSTKFEVQIYDTDDLSGKYIYVLQNNGYEDYFIFSGIIDTCKKDKTGFDRTVVAYDQAYTKSYINVAVWWSSVWESNKTITLHDLRNSLLDYIGVDYEDVILPNDSIQFQKMLDIDTIPFCYMLKMICEISCCFPHFNREGRLDFIILENETRHDISGTYDISQSSYEEYTTQAITGVEFQITNSEVSLVVGTTENPYIINENILIYGKTDDELREIGNGMMDYIPDIVYIPSNISMVLSDFSLHVGDYVTCEETNFYIFSMSFSGSQLIDQSISASGSQKRDETLEFNFDSLVADEAVLETCEDMADLVDAVEEQGSNIETMSEEITDIHVSLEKTEDSIISKVAGSQKIWDTTNYLPIQIYDYGQPEVEIIKTPIWKADVDPDKTVQVDELPDIYSLTDLDIYYLLSGDGEIYRPVMNSIGRTNKTYRYYKLIEKSVKTGETISYDVEPSDVGNKYLDQSSGKLYVLEDRGQEYIEQYRWVFLAQLKLISAELSTQIEQNATGISLEATRRYAEDANLSGRIALSATTISLGVSGNVGQNQNAGITIQLFNENGELLDSDAGNIILDGSVVFRNNLYDGTTRIDAGNISTGTVNAERINLQSITSSTDKPVTFPSSGGIKVGYSDESYFYGTQIYQNEVITNNVFASTGNGSQSYGSLRIGRAADVIIFPTKSYFRDLESVSTASNMVISNEYSSPYGYRIQKSSSSSERYKEDIRLIASEAINPHKLLDLSVKEFRYKQGYLNDLDRRCGISIPGFIAEELHEKYPVACEYDAYGIPENWNERFLIPGMLFLIQELYQKINQLKGELK